MNFITNLDSFVAVRDFFEAGGPILWPILIVTILMCALLFERVMYLYGTMPKQVTIISNAWMARKDHHSWEAKKIRLAMISELRVKSEAFLPLIKAFMAVLPLLGLLGTVYGMIDVFETMAVTGTGNPRLMAGGVQKATIPTMAGLVSALVGLIPAAALTTKAKVEVEKAEDMLGFNEE